MPNLLTIDEIRNHIETDLVDPALQQLIDDADAEIISRLGSLASVTEYYHCRRERRIPLMRPALTVTSVTLRSGEVDYPLGADDYVLQDNNRWLERRMGSTIPNLVWTGKATIVYVPAETAVSRKRLEVDLVKLAVNYDGQKAMDIGDVRTAPLDYESERNNLFKPFMTRGRRFII